MLEMTHYLAILDLQLSLFPNLIVRGSNGSVSKYDYENNKHGSVHTLEIDDQAEAKSKFPKY